MDVRAPFSSEYTPELSAEALPAALAGVAAAVSAH